VYFDTEHVAEDRLCRLRRRHIDEVQRDGLFVCLGCKRTRPKRLLADEAPGPLQVGRLAQRFVGQRRDGR
jgi:hypothetical protein